MRVRLCFFVKVLNASGRRVAGGSSMGRTVDLAEGFSAGGARIGAVLRASMGWTGVPNAGDEEGIGFSATIDGFSGRLVVAMLPDAKYVVSLSTSGEERNTLRVSRHRSRGRV